MGSWNWVLTRTAPPPFPVPVGLLFPSVFLLLSVFSYVWGPLGREEGEEGSSIFCPFGTVTSLGAPGPLSPPSFSAFPLSPICLHFLSLLTWLTSSPTPPAGGQVGRCQRSCK